MNLIEALKAVAPAVGDGKIVSAHAYVLKGPQRVVATNGKLWANAVIDASEGTFVVRHEPLLKAMDREGAVLHPGENNVRVQAGRSRVTLKSMDADDFPSFDINVEDWTWNVEPDFSEAVKNLSKFCSNADGHVWQRGVHFTSDMAFAANSHSAASYSHGWGLPHPFTLPPWAVDFILAHESPEWISDCGNMFKMGWPELTVASTKLIENPPQNVVNMLTNLASDDLQEIPDNLKEVVERANSYGIDKFRLGEGKLEHHTDEMDFEDEVALDTPPRYWGTKIILSALELATHINLSNHPGRWKGGGYVGAIAGMSA